MNNNNTQQSTNRDISMLEIHTAIDVIGKVSKTFENNNNTTIKSVPMLYRIMGYWYLSTNNYLNALKYLMWASYLKDSEALFVLSQLDIMIGISHTINPGGAELQQNYFIIRKNMPPIQTLKDTIDEYKNVRENINQNENSDDNEPFTELTEEDINDMTHMINKHVTKCERYKLTQNIRIVNPPNWTNV